MTALNPHDITQLPRAHGKPLSKGVIRAELSDFQVDETLSFQADGEGYHLLVHIEKRGVNTLWLLRQLAHFIGVRPSDVGYAGLKDRAAVTRQWFSVPCKPTQSIDWPLFNTEQWRVLEAIPHGRKLRQGSIKQNAFQIIVRNVSLDKDSLALRLTRITQEGVPNYFGEQRFGFDNLAKATAWITGDYKVKNKKCRGLYLSALRSALFNQLLAQRVRLSCWRRMIEGDVMMLQGSRSVFVGDFNDESLQRRLAEKDIMPTGPLWGRGQLMSQDVAQSLEMELPKSNELWCSFLEKVGLQQDRRGLILCVSNLEWRLDDRQQTLTLTFTLPKGCFATVVLREIIAL